MPRQYKFSELPFTDWRLEENRLQGFLKWLKWRMEYFDLDHYGCNNAYRDATGKNSPTGAPMTKEQQLWFSLIFGMTYQSEMAWVIYWDMPNIEKISLAELREWNDSTYAIQRYARDTKYNKGRIVEQVTSMLDVMDKHGSLENWINTIQTDRFDSVYKEVNALHKFGRMTTWIATQVMFETANVDVFPETLLATDPSNWSVRSGLMYLYGKDDKIESLNKGVKMTKEDCDWILATEKVLFQQCLDILPERDKKIFSYYLMESHLCQYKKLMLGGDYAGHSSGDHLSRCNWLKERWTHVNFDPFFDNVLNTKHSALIRGKHKSKNLGNLCQVTGQMINLHEMFPSEFPDMYKELDFSQDWMLTEEEEKELGKKISSYVKYLDPNSIQNTKMTLEDFL